MKKGFDKTARSHSLGSPVAMGPTENTKTRQVQGGELQVAALCGTGFTQDYNFKDSESCRKERRQNLDIIRRVNLPLQLLCILPRSPYPACDCARSLA